MSGSGSIWQKSRNEKRRAVRIPLENVTVEVYSAEGEPLSPELCDIVNLSEGGMLFKSDRRYHIGQLLRVTFLVPHTMVTVRTDAVVVHGRIDLTGHYVGVRFVKLGPAELLSLQQFVRMCVGS